MARKTKRIRNTREQEGGASPTEVKEGRPPTKKSEKDDEGWGPIGSAAKKVAKGAVKGAAKEITK